MLTPRLDMILNNISAGTVADIGTDHAYIPIELALKGISVIATDVNSGPLRVAEKNVKKHRLNVTLLQGNGLFPIPKGSAEEIIIAGMGGELIKSIISDNFEKARFSRLLLQPMNSQAELRRFLCENNFVIESEDLAKEGRKIYNLIITRDGPSKLPTREIDFHLPPLLYGHPLFPMLLEKKEHGFLKQLRGLSKSRTPDFDEINRLEKLLSEIKIIKGLRCDL